MADDPIMDYFDEHYRSHWKAEKYGKDDHYARYAKPLEEGGSNHRYYLNKALYDSLLTNPGNRVLDCACGAGRLAIWLALNGKEVWGFDSSQVAIEIARESAALSGVAHKVQFDQMDVRTLKYENNTFDIITGEDCLHHLINYREGVMELARVLKSNGEGLFIEPLAFNPIVNPLRSLRIRVKKLEGEHMLTAEDIAYLRRSFGELTMHNHVVFSFLTRFIANMHTTLHLSAVQRETCRLLYRIDTVLLRQFPFLEGYASNAFIKLRKTLQGGLSGNTSNIAETTVSHL